MTTYTARVDKGEPATATHIAKATGIPRSTVRRHLAEIKREREDQERPKVTWGEDGRVDTVQFPGKQAVKVHRQEEEQVQ